MKRSTTMYVPDETVNLKIQDYQDQSQQLKQRLLNAYSTNMVKLSKPVKTMKISEINGLYKCDLLQNITQQQQKVLSSSIPETPSSSKPRSVLQTPSRTARKGEMVFSQNGSPILQEEQEQGESFLTATVRKEKVLFALGGFELDNINNLEHMDAQSKENAKENLLRLQSQMQELMKQLE